MEHLGPIVATAAATTAEGVRAAARKARTAGADRVEVRLDLLDPGEEPLAAMALADEMPLLVSGHRTRIHPEEVPLFRRAQGLGAWVDIPHSEDITPDLFSLDPSRLVLSWHDFEGMPADLGTVLARMRVFRTAAVKLVPTAKDLPDALAVLRLLEREGGRDDLCAFAMGTPGIPTRILALAWGSCATYAAAPGCEAAAPGQMTLHEILATYGAMSLRREDPLYALAGWPLAFTKTPSFFNPWLRRTGLQGRYLPFPCQNPRDLLESGLPLRGVAVTIPHKEAMPTLTSRSSRLATLAGACNTLVPEGLGWLAANTDVYGLRRALAGVPMGTRTLMIGCGGAAAAAAIALRGKGDLAVSGRDPSKTATFAKRFKIRAIRWEEKGSATWDLLVNATPLGPEDDESPYPLDALAGRWVFDMVVRQGGTPLLRAASAQGLVTIPGEAMLVPQAALQFKLWTGKKPVGGWGDEG